VSTPFDHDEDGCRDVAVGAPGADRTGAVYVLHGSPKGFRGAEVLRQSDGRPGDEFGYSVSAASIDIPDWEDTKSVLLVGVPGRDIDGVKNAGAIATYTPGARGLLTARRVSQASPGIPGAAEFGDRFGEVLSLPFLQGFGGVDVLVGVPREDVGSAKDAGVVVHVAVMDDGEPSTHRIYRQRGGGSMGIPETGDRFGSAIALKGANASEVILAIGVPGEDIGSVQDAGAVNLMLSEDSDDSADADPIRFFPTGSLSQNSDHMPGRIERGDQFGTSVASVTSADELLFFCRDGQAAGASFAVGTPGEDVGHIANAGTVTLFDVRITGSRSIKHRCPARLIRQDGLAAGHSEKDDRLGADVWVRSSGRGVWGDTLQILIAVRGEDTPAAANSGLVAVVGITGSGLVKRPSQSFSGGPRSGLRYAELPTG